MKNRTEMNFTDNLGIEMIKYGLQSNHAYYIQRNKRQA